MSDYTVTDGRSEAYPAQHFGGHFVGSRATFCLTTDLTTFDANVQAIPNLPITILSTSPVTVEERFFGLHIYKRENDTASEAAFGTVRSHDMEGGRSRWHYIETSDNVWDFSIVDDWVNAHYAAGRDIVFTLFGTPTWASARPTEEGIYGPFNLGTQAEPEDMAKWDRFCTTVATRYLGKIKYYEVWNETNVNNDGTTTSGSLFFFSGTFAKLSEMVRRANQAIKDVDPEAKIISPSITSWTTAPGGDAETYFTGMMAASDGDGGTMKDWIDIVAVHLYFGSDIKKLPQILDNIAAAKVTAGVSDKETWDTESAPMDPEAMLMTNNAASLFIGRSMLIAAAKGVARTIYYQYDHRTMGIKHTGTVTYRNYIRDLLMGERIQAACAFADGSVGCLTASELITI